MHPRKEGWSGRARIPRPSSPRGAASSLPLSPPPCPPTDHASRPVPGRAETEGAGSRQGVWPGGRVRETDSRKQRWEWGRRLSSDSPLPLAAFLGTLVPASQAHQTGPKSWPPGPLHTGLCDLGAGWVTRAKGSLGRRLSWTPPPPPSQQTLGTVHSSNERKGRDSTVKFWCHRAGPSSPCHLLQAVTAQTPAPSGCQRTEGSACMIVTSLSVQRLFRRKTVAGISPACLAGRGGSSPRRLQVYGRGGERGEGTGDPGHP